MLNVKILGAGGHVGRSAFIITFENNTKVLVDCGIQLGDKNNTFPCLDTLFISNDVKEPPWRKCKKKCLISAVFISHYHLDHVGALPYLTEILGYEGPIYMSELTKIQAKLLLHDCWVTCKDKSFNSMFCNINVPNNEYKNIWHHVKFSETMIENCIKKIQCLQFNHSVSVEGINVVMMPAGHVAGASMFSLSTDLNHVIYTGDFTLSDSELLYHSLSEKNIVTLKNPSLIISEATYASQVRESDASIMLEICSTTYDAVMSGGKVLIPSNAMGKAQEIALALALHWKKYNVTVPIILSTGLMSQGWDIYYNMSKLELIYDIEELKSYIKVLPYKDVIKINSPIVFFSTPRSLDVGLSNQFLRLWGEDSKNLILLTGYSSNSTIANQLNVGNRCVKYESKTLKIEAKFKYISLGSHADTIAIQRLIKQLNPSHCMLIHGEFIGIQKLASILRNVCNRPVYTPSDNDSIIIKTPLYKTMLMSSKLSSVLEYARLTDKAEQLKKYLMLKISNKHL